MVRVASQMFDATSDKMEQLLNQPVSVTENYSHESGSNTGVCRKYAKSLVE